MLTCSIDCFCGYLVLMAVSSDLPCISMQSRRVVRLLIALYNMTFADLTSGQPIVMLDELAVHPQYLFSHVGSKRKM